MYGGEEVETYVYVYTKTVLYTAERVCVCAYIGLLSVAPGTRPPEQYARARPDVYELLFIIHILYRYN